MNKPLYTIAVTGLNNTDNPGPGVPVIRALRESTEFDTRIIGLAYENQEPGIYMHDIVDKCYHLPYPSVGFETLHARLTHIQRKENIDVLIPNFDAELFTFIKMSDTLATMGIKTFLPTLEQFEERHKVNLCDFGKKYGMDIPQSISITSVTDIVEIGKKFGYPLVIKGKFYDASIAYSYDQAATYFNKISAKWGLPIIVQEFVTGTEVNVIALGDGKGNTIGAVPMRKQYITDKGKAWSGITLDDQTMLDLTKNLIRQTHWRGGMELEMIRTSDDRYCVIEINPRIPAWVYLAVGAGQNLPVALVKLALGMDVVPFTKYDIGKMFIRYSYDLICDIAEYETLAMTGEL